MKKLIHSLFLATMFVSLFAFNNANALQVTVTGATVGNGTYADLSSAFSAINVAQTITDAIVITISGSTTEPAGGAILGNQNWASVTVITDGLGQWTISGAASAGLPLIDLNGADNVTFNGLDAINGNLIITNTTASATSGTSTIRFAGDAVSNTVTNCSVLGSFSATVGTNGGNIYFAAGAVSTGNDNNTISNCNIGPSASGLPTKCIFSNGSTTSTTTYNSGITISGCNIFDYFGASVASAGIYVSSGSTDWTISNNKFYQTAARTQVTTGTIHAGIQLASANINNCTISGNTIGFSSNAGTGTYEFTGVAAASKFYPIYLSTHGTITATSIQGNTVKNIKVSGNVSGTSSSGPFIGILVSTGLANIGNVTGNTIGSSTSPASIDFSSSSTSSGEIYGIYFFPSASCNISNNIVGGIRGTNTSTASLFICALRAFTTGTATNTFVNNTVGFSAAPIDNNAAISTGSKIYGLYCQSGTSIVTGNTVTNLNCLAPNGGTGTNSSVLGILIDATSATVGNNVSGNTIHTLSNSNATGNVWVSGLVYSGSTTGTHIVQKNFVHSLSIASSSATATMNGIYINGGATTYKNNMVRLGIDASGTSLTNGFIINGINETVAGTDNIYFNSVYVGGTGVTGTANTFAFQSSITTNVRNYQNNIFWNARDNGAGSGRHYAIRVGGTAVNPAGLTSNYNDLYASGTGGVLGLFNAVDRTSLALWQAAIGQDGNSFSGDPKFLNATGTSATVDLHISSVIATPIESAGLSIVSVTDDFDGQLRATLTPTDVGADAGNFISATNFPPSISYTNLPDTCFTGNRDLNGVVITDPDGIAGGSLAPRIYWRVNAGAWTSAVTSSLASPYNFTISGTFGLGDVVEYFIIAQDLLNTVGANPGTGLVATDVNTISTFPTNPNSYKINNLNWGAGSLATGNYCFNNSSTDVCATFIPNPPGQPIYYWEDTTGSTNLILNSVDVSGGLINSGGTLDDGYFRLGNIFGASGNKFRFFGIDYDSFFVSTNGVIGLTEANGNTAKLDDFTSLSIPNTTAPTACIFPFWRDMRYDNTNVTQNRLSYKYDSNNRLIITYNNFAVFGGGTTDYITMQVILETTLGPTDDNTIIVQYDNVNSGSGLITGYPTYNLTLGIQDLPGTKGIQYRRTTTPSVLGPLFNSPIAPLAVAYGGCNSALPVELASFTSSVTGNNVNLNWSTASELNNSGFDIERLIVNGQISNVWTKIGNVVGNGTSTNGKSYSFTDRNLNAGKYSYRLKQIDFNGNFEYFNLSNDVNLGVPTKFELSQNYPNPFNPSTKISFALPNDGKVSLKIYDMTGKEVMTLVNEVKTAGYYSYNFNASGLSSGVYFYSLSADNFTATKKMMLIK